MTAGAAGATPGAALSVRRTHGTLTDAYCRPIAYRTLRVRNVRHPAPSTPFIMTWRTQSLELNGKPSHAMIDDRFAVAPPFEQLPHLAWVGVFVAMAPGGGFWDPAEAAQLDAIEDDLLRLCDEHGRGWAAYVRRLDTPGLREYYFYFGEHADFEKVLPALKAAHPTYRLEWSRIDDLKWAQYTKWLSWLSMTEPKSWVYAIASRTRRWFASRTRG